jgi:hypothetical protein
MIGIHHKTPSAGHELSLGARVGAKAARRGAGVRWPHLHEIAQILLALACLGGAAALFFGWLVVSDFRRAELWGAPPGNRCASLGRGGGSCVAPATPAAPEHCPILGKGGRPCGDVPD